MRRACPSRIMSYEGRLEDHASRFPFKQLTHTKVCVCRSGVTDLLSLVGDARADETIGWTGNGNGDRNDRPGEWLDDEDQARRDVQRQGAKRAHSIHYTQLTRFHVLLLVMRLYPLQMREEGKCARQRYTHARTRTTGALW